MSVELSEARLVEVLSALAACDGSVRLAARRLEGVTEKQLKAIRAEHSGMYQAIAVERFAVQEEAIAQQLRENAAIAGRVSQAFLEKLEGELDKDELDYEMKRSLPQYMQAAAKLQQVSVDKLLSITGRPTDGGGGDVLAGVKTLMDLGVLTPKERPQSVDTTAEETP